MNLSDDTIAAPITSAGHAAVSVVRVSGAAVGKLIAQLFSEADKIQKNPRKQVFSSVLDLQKNNDVLDHGLACFFPGPNSFTGEDVLEVALHGSPYLVQRLLSNLSALGVRHAQAGEFTQRAFLNGKIDLSQAEAVADIINAETEIQAKIAREQLEGKLSQAISDLGEPLRNLLAEIEAYIDFPDEDISPITQEQWLDVLSKIAKKVEAYI
nr:tRNA uridine-5-carboxymethylaminomethyl(34) synthesis GTPase MnmE [Pseudomonadota bacterium]